MDRREVVHPLGRLQLLPHSPHREDRRHSEGHRGRGREGHGRWAAKGHFAVGPLAVPRLGWHGHVAKAALHRD